GQLTLLLGGHRGDAARHELAALRDEEQQQPDVLDVDLRRVPAGEGEGLPATEERPARRAAADDHLDAHTPPPSRNPRRGPRSPRSPLLPRSPLSRSPRPPRSRSPRPPRSRSPRSRSMAEGSLDRSGTRTEM